MSDTPDNKAALMALSEAGWSVLGCLRDYEVRGVLIESVGLSEDEADRIVRALTASGAMRMKMAAGLAATLAYLNDPALPPRPAPEPRRGMLGVRRVG